MKNQAKVLILEDQMLVAYELKAMVTKTGAEVVGPFADVDSALKAIASVEVDMAFLDINLGEGVTSEKVADMLQQLQKPFVFVTGYGSGGVLPERFRDVERYTKPVRTEDISQLMCDLAGA